MSAEPAAASETHRDFLHYMVLRMTQNDNYNLTRHDIEDAIESEVKEIQGVDDAWLEGNGLFLRFTSRNAVDIREITERVIDSISEWYHENPEPLMENLGMNPEDYS